MPNPRSDGAGDSPPAENRWRSSRPDSVDRDERGESAAPESALTEGASAALDPARNLTELLRRASAGDRTAADAAYGAIYAELRRIAELLLRGWSPQQTLDAESLLHEAYLKVSAAGTTDWNDRGHFLATMSCAMRQLLIDHWWKGKAQKNNGGKKPGPLTTGMDVAASEISDDLRDLHDAMARLRLRYPSTARIIELTYFVGLTAEQVAALVGIAPRTVVRELKFGRTFLRADLDA